MEKYIEFKSGENVPVLRGSRRVPRSTLPQSLHRDHRDGFPWEIGKQVGIATTACDLVQDDQQNPERVSKKQQKIAPSCLGHPSAEDEILTQTQEFLLNSDNLIVTQNLTLQKPRRSGGVPVTDYCPTRKLPTAPSPPPPSSRRGARAQPCNPEPCRCGTPARG